MAGKDLRQSVTAFVKQLQAKVQRLTDDATTLDVSTYTVSVGQLAATIEEIEGGAVDVLAVRRCGHTRITFTCDLASCVETGRTDEVDPAVDAVHRSVVDLAVVGRDAALSAAREVIERVR